MNSGRPPRGRHALLPNTLITQRFLLYLSFLLFTCGGQLGCKSAIGPQSIIEDRIPYNEAVALSWKEQTLLNIVKLRYMDTPFFVDVPQITSGYTFQQQSGLNTGIYPPTSNLNSFAQQLGLSLNLQKAYQDRPTISYTPQTGSQFIRSLTNPLNPGSVLFLVQSGYPADVVFDLTVDSINGIRNRTVQGGELRAADPDFATVVQTLRRAQINGHVGMRIQRGQDKSESLAIFFRDQNFGQSVDSELLAELAELRRILGLDPDTQEFNVVFAGSTSGPKEVAIITRSAYRVLMELSSYVEVPVEHLELGIAPPIGEQSASEQQPFRVLSGCEKPCDAFVSVCYEGRWFWIEKSDFFSKRSMNFLLILLAQADTGQKESLPVMTIQAN